jgi:type I restriction enzyme, R subunit
MTIYKLNHNKPITARDMKMLEDILWKELGTREDYEKDFGVTPITNLVRQIVGLNSKAANEALSWVIRP